MVTLHRNGDIVTHPDHAANYRRRVKKYDEEGRCKYGVKEFLCPVYMRWCAKYAKEQHKRRIIKYETPRCTLCGDVKPARVETKKVDTGMHPTNYIKCPAMARNFDNGNKKKQFRITNSHYRKLADQTAYLKETAKSKILFITLTFGKWKNKPITGEQANEAFSKFIENLRRNYSAGNYVAVREGNNQDLRLHYHLIIAMPFNSFISLNNAWNSAISEHCEYSGRALFTDKEARFIKSTVSAVKYVCKYISKARGTSSDTRIIFTSRELSQAELKADFSGNDLPTVLRNYGSINCYKCNEFTWRYSISAPTKATEAQKKRAARAANAFYYSVVRLFFGHTDRKNTELYHYSDNNKT